MTTEAARAEARAERPPYAPGWVHVVGDRIDRAAVPALVIYGLIGVVAIVGMHLAAWTIDPEAFGTIDPGLLFFGLLPGILLWAIDHLERQAGLAFDAFRPALALSEGEQDRLRYALSILPAELTLGITIAAVAITGGGYVLDPAGTAVAGMPLPALAFRFVVESLNVALLFLLLAQLIRQMRQVRRTLARSTVVDLFQPGPIYAFSRLTSRAGMILVLVVGLSILLNPLPADLTVQQFLVNWAPYFIVPPVIAVIAFVVPLSGLHDQLVAEKDRLQGEADARLKRHLDEVHRDVDSGDLRRVDGLNKALETLLREREVIATLPTWPWSTGTLRAFVSAILLPLFLFVIQLLLSRVL